MNIFKKEDLRIFESLWNGEYGSYTDLCEILESLTDEQYIDFKIWEDIKMNQGSNEEEKNVLIIGKTTNLPFHGGCLKCLSQHINGIERCKGCCYFRAEWRKQNLKIGGGTCDSINLVEVFKDL